MYQQAILQSRMERIIGRQASIDPKAVQMFERLHGAASGTGLAGLFHRQHAPLASLEDERDAANRHTLGVQVVALDAICGTLNRQGDFDSAFRPLQSYTEGRWVRVATAMLRGISLPPVDLVKIGERYYVRDGHHRVSVARALGYAYIDAVVEEWKAA